MPSLITLDTLQRWLTAPAENEHLEFKEAKQQYDWQKTLEYCVAMANEGGGFLVLGVADKPPRKVVGTRAFLNLNETKEKLFDKLRLRVEITELAHADGRVLVLDIPSRPKGHPLEIEGSYLARVGESVRPMSGDQLRRIFAEGQMSFLDQPARSGLAADEVVALLDIQTYFDLMRLPFPSNREGILARLTGEGLVRKDADQYAITNLGAVLLAKDLRQFQTLWRKAPRVIVYKGQNKLETVRDQPGSKGYAVGFEGLIGFINSQLPANEVIGQARREEVRMYPEIAVRELVANALIHQDFTESGTSVMVEIYDDRMEISNPGKPFISPDRFIDEYQSRNERLADLMRRLGICEEKGSGVDKVIQAAEVFQLPAPDFRVGEKRTTAVLFSHKAFEAMDRSDRIRATYQHCCLRYVMNQKMTNQSLRERFKLPEKKSESISRAIGAAVDDKKIKPADPEQTSLRYRNYIPFWA